MVRAGGPCRQCNALTTSQWKPVPPEMGGGDLCKSQACWRLFGHPDAKPLQKRGRKRSDEALGEEQPEQVQPSLGKRRAPPLFLTEVKELRGVRYALPSDSNPTRCGSHNAELAPCCLLAFRHDTIDCERETVDKKIRRHRRNKMPYPMESTVEFKILGHWKTDPDDDGEPDTHYVTVGDMLENGLDKNELKSAIEAFYEASMEAALAAVDAYEVGNLDEAL